MSIAYAASSTRRAGRSLSSAHGSVLVPISKAPARDLDLGREQQRRRGGQGVGRRQDRLAAAQLVGGQHGLVVLVLVLQDHAKDEAVLAQRVRRGSVGPAQRHRLQCVEDLATHLTEVVVRLAGQQQRQAGPGVTRVLEGVVEVVDLGAHRLLAARLAQQPELLVVADVGQVPHQGRHQPGVLGEQVGLVEHVGGEPAAASAHPLELVGDVLAQDRVLQRRHVGPGRGAGPAHAISTGSSAGQRPGRT